MFFFFFYRWIKIKSGILSCQMKQRLQTYIKSRQGGEARGFDPETFPP
jgi:hypothetical protein